MPVALNYVDAIVESDGQLSLFSALMSPEKFHKGYSIRSWHAHPRQQTRVTGKFGGTTLVRTLKWSSTAQYNDSCATIPSPGTARRKQKLVKCL